MLEPFQTQTFSVKFLKAEGSHLIENVFYFLLFLQISTTLAKMNHSLVCF